MPLIGVSVAVPDPIGARLQDYRIALGESEAEGIPTHITLVPPLEVAGIDLDEIEAHLAATAAEHPAYLVHLRGTGTFAPVSPVVFVNLVQGISQCELLADALCSGPLTVDLDFPYHPHVTVAAHGADEAARERAFNDLADFEAEFWVRGFWLHRYDEPTGWVPVREFALGS